MRILDKDFIKGFLRISLPLVITQLLANLVNMADTVMLGALAEKAISGASVANRVFFIYSLTLFGLTNGIGLYISQYYGAENKERYNQTFRYGLLLCIAVSLVAIVIVVAFPEQIVGLFVKDPITIQYSLDYLSVIKWTFIPFAISQMCGVIYRVTGMTKVPMYCGTIAFVTNVSLNYLLIFGNFGFPALGVTGAAIATCIARICELAFLLYITNRHDSDFAFRIKVGKMESSLRFEIMKTSIPLVINELIWSLGLSTVFMNYSFVGEEFIPALNVSDNISNLIFSAFSGCASAAGVFVGNRLGAGKLDEAKQNAKKLILLSLIIYIVGGAIILITSPYTPYMYSLSGEISAIATKLLIIKALTAWTQGYSLTIYYILRAGGDTKSVLIIDGVFTCVGPVLVSFICARIFHFTILPLYLAVEGMGLIKIFIATYFYKKEDWIKTIA